MNPSTLPNNKQIIIERQNFQRLLDVLKNQGYQLRGPTVREGAIVYDEINLVKDLPEGWTDVQDKASYRLQKRDDKALFGYVVGPHSWKKFLHPPVLKLWEAKRCEDGFEIKEKVAFTPQYAFIGVRSCELHAIAIQDKVFIEGPYVDTTYKNRREKIFVVAINCGEAGETCFCTSMNTGPQVSFGFDLALTEVIQPDRHYFVVMIGSAKGHDVIKEIPHTKASNQEISIAQSKVEQAREEMGRTMDTSDIKNLLYRNHDHTQWDKVAERCLSCGNCTMVCPTCFCTTVEDVTDLTGEETTRVRKWDSCFTMDFSYLHGGSVRTSVKSRYRQWMTHKLATWIDQFDTSGCVGCGRCISWCPVGIDITEEVAIIQEDKAKEKNDENA